MSLSVTGDLVDEELSVSALEKHYFTLNLFGYYIFHNFICFRRQTLYMKECS